MKNLQLTLLLCSITYISSAFPADKGGNGVYTIKDCLTSSLQKYEQIIVRNYLESKLEADFRYVYELNYVPFTKSKLTGQESNDYSTFIPTKHDLGSECGLDSFTKYDVGYFHVTYANHEYYYCEIDIKLEKVKKLTHAYELKLTHESKDISCR